METRGNCNYLEYLRVILSDTGHYDLPIQASGPLSTLTKGYSYGSNCPISAHLQCDNDFDRLPYALCVYINIRGGTSSKPPHNTYCWIRGPSATWPSIERASGQG